MTKPIVELRFITDEWNGYLECRREDSDEWEPVPVITRRDPGAEGLRPAPGVHPGIGERDNGSPDISPG